MMIVNSELTEINISLNTYVILETSLFKQLTALVLKHFD